MTGASKLAFSLKIQNSPKNVTFFSIPSTNNYQEVASIYYSKNQFRKVKEDLYGNTVLILGDPIPTKISFNLFPKSQNIKLNDQSISYPTSSQKYLKNNKYINSNDLDIQQIARRIRGQTLDQILKNSYDFVLGYLTYGSPVDGLYTYKQAFKEKVTDCGGFSTLLCSILNAKKVPTRLVVGFLIKQNMSTKFHKITKIKPLGFENLYMHAWAEALLPDGSWFPMDPSIEWRRKKGLTKREGGFGNIADDRLVLSFGQDFQFDFEEKKYNIEILQKPVILKK